jgi:hypothetical protein
MSLLSLFLSLVIVVVSVALAKYGRGVDVGALATVERAAAGRYVPVVLGAINALLVWWMFGFERYPIPVIQDEAVYLLQAELFALGRWTGAAPPLPEFFVQMHVLTEPVLASKYPPGMSFFLTPFVWLGFLSLGPMVLAGAGGALVFVLARRVGNAAVAVFSWLLWTTAPGILRWQATFLSQTVTTVLWLGALYLLLEYRDRRRPWALVALAGVVGACAITRPVTAIALAVPVGVLALRLAIPARAWGALGGALVTVTAIVAILPLQNHQTTGDWRLSPLVKYSREYLPSDFPGFGFDSTRPVAPLPPDLEHVRQELFEIRRQHTLEALPRTLAHRWLRSVQTVALSWRFGLVLMLLLGALLMPTAGTFAFCMSVGLLLAYALHAHWPQWPQYYLEATPGYVFAIAAGVWALASWMIRGWSTIRRRTLWDGAEPRVALAVLVAAVALGVPSALRVPAAVAAHSHAVPYHRRFVEALKLVQRDSEKAIVFVNYGRRPNAHSLVRNVPDLANARTWIAYDRGPDDLRLMRLAPERRAYIYHTGDGRLTRLPPLAELERIVASQ